MPGWICAAPGSSAPADDRGTSHSQNDSTAHRPAHSEQMPCAVKNTTPVPVRRAPPTVPLSQQTLPWDLSGGVVLPANGSVRRGNGVQTADERGRHKRRQKTSRGGRLTSPNLCSSRPATALGGSPVVSGFSVCCFVAFAFLLQQVASPDNPGAGALSAASDLSLSARPDQIVSYSAVTRPQPSMADLAAG